MHVVQALLTTIMHQKTLFSDSHFIANAQLQSTSMDKPPGMDNHKPTLRRVQTMTGAASVQIVCWSEIQWRANLRAQIYARRFTRH